MSDSLDSRISFGHALVAEQVTYFSEHFGRVESAWKEDGSRITEADIHLSLVFSDALGEAFPEDQFFSEELDHGEKPLSVTAQYSWLLDPIDGTNNFARGLPTCSISLALLENGNPIYGYIYDHASGKLLHGGPGRDLWIGGEKAEVVERPVTGQSLICVQALSSEQSAADEHALRMDYKLRTFGSSALHMAYAALGWSDGVVAHRVKSWDIAAGIALVAAVGGCTRFFDTEVFPLKEFSSKAGGFGHIAGSVEMCDAIERSIDRKCRYSI